MLYNGSSSVWIAIKNKIKILPLSLPNFCLGTEVPRHSAGVVRTYVRTWYAFSSTRAMPRAIRRPTPTIIAHSLASLRAEGRQEGKPRRDSSIAIDRQPVNKKPLYRKGEHFDWAVSKGISKKDVTK